MQGLFWKGDKHVNCHLHNRFYLKKDLYIEGETKRANIECVKQLLEGVIASLCFFTVQPFKPTSPHILCLSHPAPPLGL